jgi:hypothetical protein
VLTPDSLEGTDTGRAAILTEGEFDGMLLWEEAVDLVGWRVATLGSCNRGGSTKGPRYLLGCSRLRVAYEVDAEGGKGAERLGQISRACSVIGRRSQGRDGVLASRWAGV